VQAWPLACPLTINENADVCWVYPGGDYLLRSFGKRAAIRGENSVLNKSTIALSLLALVIGIASAAAAVGAAPVPLIGVGVGAAATAGAVILARVYLKR
jgi:hypothetical protein